MYAHGVDVFLRVFINIIVNFFFYIYIYVACIIVSISRYAVAAVQWQYSRARTYRPSRTHGFETISTNLFRIDVKIIVFDNNVYMYTVQRVCVWYVISLRMLCTSGIVREHDSYYCEYEIYDCTEKK